MKKVYVFPGQLASSAEPTEFTTILGSCVSVVLYDRRTRIGGLNHFLLPRHQPKDDANPRYGTVAIPQLYNSLLALGANPKFLQAQVYGGANVIATADLGQSVGAGNVELALAWLSESAIPIETRDVGGERGRRLVFDTSSFEVKRAYMSQSGGEAEPARPLRVLVVDDSVTMRNVIANALVASGIEVVGRAADAYEARELIVRAKPDAITLDIEMPKMDGVAFLEKLMRHHPLPVAMVSGLSPQETRGASSPQEDPIAKAMQLGAAAFIKKPSLSDEASSIEFKRTLGELIKSICSEAKKRKSA